MPEIFPHARTGDGIFFYFLTMTICVCREIQILNLIFSLSSFQRIYQKIALIRNLTKITVIRDIMAFRDSNQAVVSVAQSVSAFGC